MVIVQFWQCPECKGIDITKSPYGDIEKIHYCPYCKPETCKECGEPKADTRPLMRGVGISLHLDKC